jgi:hypothetical protein
MILIKNKTAELKTWCGQEIAANDTHTISQEERNTWGYDAIFLGAVINGEASIISDGIEITDLIEVEIVLRNENKRDEEGNPIYRNIIAEANMLFQPRCIDFSTATYKSICNKSSDLVDIGDAELLFFDEEKNQILKGETETDEEYQARLNLECEHTYMYFTPSYKYAIKSGEIRYRGTLGEESDVWIEVAPHIPKEYGGSVPFINGGLPLDFYEEKKSILIDGGTCTVIDVDTTYYTHRLGVKIEHGIGIKIGFLAIFNIYR